MGDSDHTVMKRERASTSKVRTGCKTCKMRRIKCDEEKPSCRRCMTSGRTCNYKPTQSSAPRRNIVTMYVPSVHKALVSFSSSRELDFYHQKVARKLSGYFDADFWNGFVMQMCQAEPAIQYAVTAITTVHRELEASPVEHSNGYTPPTSLALEECNAAMRCLSRRIETDPTSKLVPLVTCLLFMCLEFIRGNTSAAMVHMTSGFKILRVCQEPSPPTAPQQQHSGYADQLAIEKHIVPLFSRLELLGILFKPDLPPFDGHSRASNTPFTTVAEARQRLAELMARSLRVIRHQELLDDDSHLKIEDYIKKVQLKLELQQWKDVLEALVLRLIQIGQPPNEDSINLLRLHHRVFSVWLCYNRNGDATEVDKYHYDFIEIVELATKITPPADPQSDRMQPEHFSFEMQTIGPLYLTAVKCRLSPVRHRALALLRLATRREGLWNAHVATKVAERVIEIEERDMLLGQELPPVTSRVRGRLMPSDLEAIKAGEHAHSESGGSTLSDSTPPDRIKLRFQSQPWGVTGAWHVFHEEVIL